VSSGAQIAIDDAALPALDRDLFDRCWHVAPDRQQPDMLLLTLPRRRIRLRRPDRAAQRDNSIVNGESAAACQGALADAFSC
jgi:hypothetical protein